MAQLAPCNPRSEAPINPGMGQVAFGFQGLDFPPEGGFVGDALVQTLPAEHAQLQLGHVQPTTMLGGVVELQALENPPSLDRGKGLIQGSRAMGVQVVQDYPDHLSFRIGFIHQPPHLLGEVLHRALFGHLQVPPALLRLEEQKQVAAAVTLVLVIVPLPLARPGGQAHPGFGYQLLVGLVEADLGPPGVVGFLVEVQDVLHVGHELGVYLRDAPLLLLPGLEVCFLRTCRTVSLAMESAKPNSTALPARSRRVQRAWPSGGSLQAMAMRWAASLPVSSTLYLAAGIAGIASLGNLFPVYTSIRALSKSS